jgi:membrane protease YdiL (CAAX protease family)
MLFSILDFFASVNGICDRLDDKGDKKLKEKLFHSRWLYLTYIGLVLIVYRLTFSSFALSMQGWGYLLGEVVALAAAIMLIGLNKNNRQQLLALPPKQPYRQVTGRQLGQWFMILLLLQFLFDPAMFGFLSRGYAKLGPAFAEEVHTFFALPSLSDYSGLVITVIVAPIFEEILFRGVFLNVLTRYTDGFAVVASSIAFGIAHGNLIQGTFAFFCGILFGCAYLQYGLKVTIPLHMFMNGVLGTLADVAFVQLGLPNNTIAVVLGATFIIAAILWLVIRWLPRVRWSTNNWVTLGWLVISPTWIIYAIIAAE